MSVFRPEGSVVVLDSEREGEGDTLERMADLMGVLNALMCEKSVDEGVRVFLGFSVDKGLH